MKRTSLFATLALAAGVSASFLSPTTATLPPGQGAVAGTFFVAFNVTGLGTLSAIVTAHPDGTMISSDQSDFGLGGAVEKNTPSMGSWWFSGPRQTTDTRLTFGFDANGVPNRMVYRVTAVTDWDAGFDNGSGTADIRVYDLSLGEDPTDPAQGTPGNSLTFVAKRLQ